MGFRGRFEKYRSPRCGGLAKVRFILTCSNMFQSETFDVTLLSPNGERAPLTFRNLTLKAGKSFEFSYDTVDWQWCHGDELSVAGRKGRVVGRWVLDAGSYEKEGCGDCFGSRKCRRCSGKGFVYLSNDNVERCPDCLGTGVCQTCGVPQSSGDNGLNVKSRQKIIAGLRSSLEDYQSKIAKVEWELRMMQLKNIDVTNPSVFSSYQTMLAGYRKKMAELQSQLEQIEGA